MSSQEWKSVEMLGARTGRPVDDKFVIEDDMDSDRHRIKPFSKITIILEQREWSTAKDVGRCSSKHRQTFFDLVNVDCVFDIGNICFHGIGKNFNLQQMFETSEKLILEQTDEIFAVSRISSENSPWNSHLWSMMKKSSVSRMQGLSIFRFCVVIWKGESEPNIKNCLGTAVGLVQRFITIQNFGHNSRRTMEFEWRANQNNSENESSSCRCSMTSCGELKTMNRNVLPIPYLCLFLQKDFQQDIGDSSVLDPKHSGILLTTKDHKENGTESRNWWWSNSEKADTQFSEPRVHCPEERSKT